MATSSGKQGDRCAAVGDNHGALTSSKTNWYGFNHPRSTPFSIHSHIQLHSPPHSFSLFDLPLHANLLGELEMRLLCEESGATWNTWSTRRFPGAGCQFRKSYAHTCVCSFGKRRGRFWKEFVSEGGGFWAGLKTRLGLSRGDGVVLVFGVEQCGGGMWKTEGNCLGLGFTEWEAGYMVNFYGNAMHFMCVWCCTWEGERDGMHGRGREGECVEIKAPKQG